MKTIEKISKYLDRIPPLAWVVLIALAVFLSAFYIYQTAFAPTEHTINNVLLIMRGDPKAVISNILASDSLVEQIYADNTSDKTLACSSIIAAEASRALGASGKKVFVQGLVGGQFCVNENNTRQDCRSAQLLVKRGTCNCVKTNSDGTGLIVEGNDLWMCANGARVRDLLRWALSKS